MRESSMVAKVLTYAHEDTQATSAIGVCSQALTCRSSEINRPVREGKGRSCVDLRPKNYAIVASTTDSGPFVGTTRVSWSPAVLKSAPNSASVRSRPPGIISISRSIIFPRSG